MDVRCEKCQTEYELDEARLKPGGVTVKCTNCGHMFKIRKRATTNVGAPPPGESRPLPTSTPTVPSAPVAAPRTQRDSASFDEPTRTGETGDERQWLIRLENGEQKSCRELSLLQQWIVAGVVTRESLISRTGKTWKRIGDITELAQYFTIADDARQQRQQRTTKPSAPVPRASEAAQTMLGVGTRATAAGGTVLPDDDDDLRSTGNFRARQKSQPPPPPPASKSGVPADDAGHAATLLSTGPHPRRPTTQPPPPPQPAKKDADRSKGTSVPASNRATAAWATDGLAPSASADAGPSGPLGGKIKVQTDPGFAGRVRVEPGESTAFRSGGGTSSFEDDDEVMPARKGSKAGWIMLVVLLLVGGGGAAAYFLVLQDRGKGTETAQAGATTDAADVAPDAGLPATTIDALPAPVAGPLELARAALAGDRDGKLREALTSIAGLEEPGADALRAYLTGAIAQQLLDRAAVTADRSEADKLKKEAKTVITDALGPAQKAVRTAPDDVTANLAMATVLRVQNKSARDIKKYVDKAKAKVTPELALDLALAEALVLARDGKLADAKALLAPLDAGKDKLESSGDVRPRLRLAFIALGENKPAEAKPLVESVLALAPDHLAAKALSERLQTAVATTDPLPPEDGPGPGSATKPQTPPGPSPTPTPGDSYDRLLEKANTLAERNCTQAMDVYAKALEQKPNGVDALTGMGYCHVDAKQFQAAYSKFRAALAISSRYEPALWGIAETYLQQGRKEQALEAVKAYVAVHGETPKAKKALDRLGGGSSSSTPPTPPDDGGGAGSATAPPATPPTTPPTPPTPPPPPDEGAGSGSE